MNRSLFTPLAVIAVAALALTGCATGGGGEKLDPAKSPLAEYMTAIYGGDKGQEFYNAQQVEMEELMAACMAEEGFDYVPVDYSKMNQGPAPQTDEEMQKEMEERETEKWVAENGYGFTTYEQPQDADPNQPVFVDPNQAYTEALSEAERTAYYEVLYGVSPTEEEMADETYEYNWENAGCQGKAQHETQGDQPYDDEKYRPLLDSMNTIYEKMQDDPSIAELDVKWASCMADAGYADFSKKQDAQESIIELQNEMYNPETGEPVGGEELERIKKLEIDTALADFRCSEDLNYQNAMLKVQFDLEEQFIADNKSELDAMVAEYEQAG